MTGNVGARERNRGNGGAASFARSQDLKIATMQEVSTDGII